MMECPICMSELKQKRLACAGCDITIEGDFYKPRLARLSKDHQKLAEAFLLYGGSMKDLATEMNISYPTLRKRIDDMIEALSELQKTDEEEITIILDRIENSEIKAEKGLRLIKEINNEL